MSDRHKLMSDDTGKMLVLKAKGNNGIRQHLGLLPFDNSKEYTTKTKTIYEQKMRQNYVAERILIVGFTVSQKQQNHAKHSITLSENFSNSM